MATRDLVHNTKVLQALNPATIAATTRGIIIDSQGFQSLTFEINVGIFATFTTTNKWTFTVEESDNATDTGFAEISAGSYIEAYKNGASGWARTCTVASDAQAAFTIGVRISLKRYYMLVLTLAGTVSAIAGASAVLGHPIDAPVGATV